jgi:hypothetical protein
MQGFSALMVCGRIDSINDKNFSQKNVVNISVCSKIYPKKKYGSDQSVYDMSIWGDNARSFLKFGFKKGDNIAFASYNIRSSIWVDRIGEYHTSLKGTIDKFWDVRPNGLKGVGHRQLDFLQEKVTMPFAMKEANPSEAELVKNSPIVEESKLGKEEKEKEKNFLISAHIPFLVNELTIPDARFKDVAFPDEILLDPSLSDEDRPILNMGQKGFSGKSGFNDSLASEAVTCDNNSLQSLKELNTSLLVSSPNALKDPAKSIEEAVKDPSFDAIYDRFTSEREEKPLSFPKEATSFSPYSLEEGEKLSNALDADENKDALECSLECSEEELSPLSDTIEKNNSFFSLFSDLVMGNDETPTKEKEFKKIGEKEIKEKKIVAAKVPVRDRSGEKARKKKK